MEDVLLLATALVLAPAKEIIAITAVSQNTTRAILTMQGWCLGGAVVSVEVHARV
jgi:hypothetical protein